MWVDELSNVQLWPRNQWLSLIIFKWNYRYHLSLTIRIFHFFFMNIKLDWWCLNSQYPVKRTSRLFRHIRSKDNEIQKQIANQNNCVDLHECKPKWSFWTKFTCGSRKIWSQAEPSLHLFMCISTKHCNYTKVVHFYPWKHFSLVLLKIYIIIK